MTADSSAKNNPRLRPTAKDLRRRARNRLIGSAVLVTVVIVLFGFLFDSKPRSVTEEVDFAVPEQGQVKPIGTAEGQQEITDLDSSSGVAVPLDAPVDALPGGMDSGSVEGVDSLSPNEEFVGTWEDETAAQQRNAAAAAPAAKPQLTTDTAEADYQARQQAQQQAKEKAKAKEKAAQKAASERAEQEKEKERKKEQEQAKRKAEQEKAAAARAEAARKAEKKAEEARVQAILRGKKEKSQQEKTNAGKQSAGKTAASTGGQYIVQFGSLKDPVRAEAVRAEVAAKGLSAYTQTADTAKGTYTRLRSGPYSSKAAADAAAAKIKAMGHPVLVKRQQ